MKEEETKQIGMKGKKETKLLGESQNSLSVILSMLIIMILNDLMIFREVRKVIHSLGGKEEETRKP